MAKSILAPKTLGSQALSLSGGGSHPWQLASLETRLKDRILHPRAFEVVVSGTIRQANGAGALAAIDIARAFSVKLSRGAGKVPVILPGYALLVYSALLSGGRMRSPLPCANIGANSSGSNVDTTFVLRLLVPFDSPLGYDSDAALIASAAFRGGSLTLDYADPTTTYGTGFTFLTAVTAELWVHQVGLTRARFGVDAQRFARSGAGTTGGSHTLERGYRYDIVSAVLAAAGGAFGTTLDGGSSYSQELPSISPARYRDAYLSRGGIDTDDNVVSNGYAAPMLAPQASDRLTDALNCEADLIVTYTGTTTGGMLLLVSRIVPRDPTEMRAVAAELLGKDVDYTWVPACDGARISADRLDCVPFELYEGRIDLSRFIKPRK